MQTEIESTSDTFIGMLCVYTKCIVFNKHSKMNQMSINTAMSGDKMRKLLMKLNDAIV